MHARECLAVLLACLLTTQAAGQSSSGQTLRIIPLEGHNSVNYLVLRTGTAPIVEVRDENDRPVEGAAVTFKLPSSGAGASFDKDEKLQTAITDSRGQAGTNGYTINNTPGRFVIEISAAYQGRSARFLMTQVNSEGNLPPELGGAAKSNRWKWVLIGLAAGVGTGAGVYFATRGNSTPILVSTGPVVVAGPR